MRSKITFAIFLFVFCSSLTTLIYASSLSFPFQFDDTSNIVQNRGIRYLWHPRILFEHAQTRSRPVSALSYAIDYARGGGLSLSAFRLTNLVLHTFNALLVAFLFLQWFQGRKLAWLGALASAGLFLALPIAVDSVVYLSARSTLLSLLFVLLGLAAHSVNPPNIFSFLGFFAAAIAGFLSKESAVVLLPLLVVIHRMQRRVWREVLPYALPLVIGGMVHFFLKLGYLDGAWQGYFHIQGAVEVSGFADYTRLSLSLWPRILELFFLPSRMAFDHEIFLPGSWLDLPVLGGIAFWAVSAIFLLVWLRKPHFWQLPLLWIALSLLPTNSIFPVLDPLAERHLYLAVPALAWAAGIFLVLSSRVWIFPVLAALIGLSTHFALQRVPVWSTAASIWEDSYQKYPNKFRVVFNTAIYRAQVSGNFESALIIFYQYFRSVSPGMLPYQQQELITDVAANFLTYLGKDKEGILRVHKSQEGKSFLADLSLLKALRGKDDFALWRKRWQEALSNYKALPLASGSDDDEVVAHSLELLLAMELISRGQREEAFALLEKVILPFEGVHIPYWTKREALGDLYLSKGETIKALEQFELAATQYKVFKQFPETIHRKIYSIRVQQNDYLRASDAMGELTRLHTDDPEIRRLYAEALSRSQSRHATRQLREAEFYSGKFIRPNDEREFIRP